MRKTLTINLIALTLLAQLCSSVYAQAQDKVLPLQPEVGELTADTYTNRFFGLHLTFPSDWSVYNATGIKLAEEDSARRRGISPEELARLRSHDLSLKLFTASQYVDPLPQQGNTGFMCWAMPLIAINDTPARYLQRYKESTLPRMYSKFEVLEDIGAETIGGHDAAFMVVKLPPVGGRVGRIEETHVMTLKGYLLVFTLSYIKDEQRDLAHRILGSVRFDE